MDKIIIKNLKLYAFHGVNREEKINGQNFYLDIECALNLSEASLDDDINSTVSYADIIKSVRKSFLKERYDLLEKAAGEAALGVLNDFPKVNSVKITLKKPEAPVKASFDYAAVEIEKTR